MKKINLFLILIICITLNIDNVFAEKINRFYNDESGIAGTFLLQYDTETKRYELGLPIHQEYQRKEDKEYVEAPENFDYVLAFELGTYEQGTNFVGREEFIIYLNEEPVKEITNEQALEVHYCISSYDSSGSPNASGTASVYIFSDSLQKSDKENQGLKREISKCIDLKSNEAKEGKVESVNECKTYETHSKEIEKQFKNYKTIGSIKEAKKRINLLKTLCNSITKYVDFDDSCMKYCLDFPEWLNEMEKKYNIEVGPGQKACGFSEKLILYIANIVKWVKYIVPVLVIVLGILDFIKAISSEKDDEMKKAQGRFVKRLIAAALIFIVPFVIEFVLEKMGFSANGCGIIDL